MYDMKKARCAECPCYLEYREKEPRSQHGTTMRPGCRYCLAGKRARLFKKKDPKIYVPKWCPKRIYPPVLRIYEQWESLPFYYPPSCRSRKDWLPIASGYRLRYEGQAPNTGPNFYTIIHNREKDHMIWLDEISEELGVSFTLWEIIEFDDGVKPMFYWLMDRFRQTVFDRDQAKGYPPKND